MYRINALKARAFTTALCALWMAGAMWLQPAAAQSPLHTVILGVVLNGATISSGETFLEDEQSHLLASGAFLQRWNLRSGSEAPRLYEGVDYFDLQAIGELQTQRDTARSELTLQAQSGAFNLSERNANALQTSTALPYVPGGFVNYDAAFTQTPQGDSHDALLGLGLFAGNGLVTNNIALRDASSVRLMSTYQSDNPQAMKTLRVGDAVNTTGAWGLGVLFGGVQYGTNFAVRPDYIAQAMPGVTGDALLPSTVDVYVNNVLRTRQNVDAGPFAIQNLPLVNGQGDLQVVVRDVLGREQLITQPFMASPALLREGLLQDAYEAGALRRNYGLQSDDYGDPFATITLRRGMQSSWTAELRAEAQRDATTVGLSNDFALPQLSSLIEGTVAASGGAQNGSLVGALYSYTGSRLAINARAAWTSPGFRQLGSDLNNLPGQLASVQAAMPLGAGTVIANYLQRQNQNEAPLRILNLSYSQRVNAHVFANLSVLTTNAQVGATVQAGITVMLDSKHFSNASVNHSAQGDTRYADFAQAADSAEGTGYRLATTQGSGGAMQSADFTSNHAGGSWGAQAQQQAGATSTRLWATGGAATLGNGVYWTRGIDQSFAIVQVGQAADVPVYLESQLVARTRADGTALVNNLRAYQDNRVSVDPLAVPLDSSVGAMSRTVQPRWLGGVVLDFEVHPVIGMTLVVSQADGTLLPPWTSVELAGASQSFVTGRRGEVYVEFPHVGTYRLTASPAGGKDCSLVVQAMSGTTSATRVDCQ
jgi:outer membrane usher protein